MATSLATRLGIKPGHRVALLGTHPLDPQALSDIPCQLVADLEAELDVIVFCTDRLEALAAAWPALKAALGWRGGLWIGWPKRASGWPTEMHFDAVQAMGLALGLVDNKVCAIDDVWTGLRFVYRKADRPKEHR